MKTQRAVLPPDASAFLHGSISMWYNDSPSKKSGELSSSSFNFGDEIMNLTHIP